MRKRYQKKRRSCPVCHPNKMGRAPRWKERELYWLQQWERERKEWEQRQRKDATE